tara:strand:+ start:4591 stop:4785 length:195 start_codon:yes stop_codon:yes gene_type:complete
MKTLTDAQEIEDSLKGCVVEVIAQAQDDTSIEIYFTNGTCICIEGERIEYLGVNAQLEVEVRLS